MKKFFQEFKAFAMKGNVIDLAVGVIIGGAFGKIVASLVNDIFMPLISLLLGGTNVSGLFILLGESAVPVTSIDQAKELGVATFNYGSFIQNVIDFVIIALVIFLFIKAMSKLQKPAPAPVAEPARLCDYCRQEVAKDATRCPHCTSEIHLKAK